MPLQMCLRDSRIRRMRNIRSTRASYSKMCRYRCSIKALWRRRMMTISASPMRGSSFRRSNYCRTSKTFRRYPISRSRRRSHTSSGRSISMWKWRRARARRMCISSPCLSSTSATVFPNSLSLSPASPSARA